MDTKELTNEIGMSKTDISKAIADAKNLKSYRTVLNWSNDRILNEYNRYVIEPIIEQQQPVEQQQQQQPVKPVSNELPTYNVGGKLYAMVNDKLVPIDEQQPVRETVQNGTKQPEQPKYNLINGFAPNSPLGEAINQLDDRYELVIYGAPKPNDTPSNFIIVRDSTNGMYCTVRPYIDIGTGHIKVNVQKDRLTVHELLSMLGGKNRRGTKYLKSDYYQWLQHALPNSNWKTHTETFRDETERR